MTNDRPKPLTADEAAALEALDLRVPAEHLPPPSAGNRMARAGFSTARRKPEVLKELTPKMRLLCEYMVVGAPKRIADQLGKQQYEPLTLEEAAFFLGFRFRNAREIARSEVFRREYARQLQRIREGAHVDAVRTMIDIMTDEGDGSAATKTVRLKAARAVLGEEGGKSGPQVNVQINNSQQLTAGVVVRVPQRQAPEAAPATIEAQPARLPVRLPRGPTAEADPAYRDLRAKRFDQERQPLPPIQDEH